MTDFEIAMVLISSFLTSPVGITIMLIIVAFEWIMRRAERKRKEECHKEWMRDQQLDFRNMSDERLQHFLRKVYWDGRVVRKNEQALFEKMRRDHMRMRK